MATAERWRVLITDNNGDSTTGASEVEFRESFGVSQVPSGGSPFASTFWTSGTSPDKAFDGDTGSRWLADDPASYPEHIGYNYGTGNGIEVVQVAISAPSFGASRAPKDFQIQAFNGSTWDTVLTVTGETGWSTEETRTFSVVDPYEVTGIVTLDGSPVEATIRAYKTSDGALITEKLSNPSDGSYVLGFSNNDPVNIVVEEPNARPLAHGPVTPVAI